MIPDIIHCVWKANSVAKQNICRSRQNLQQFNVELYTEFDCVNIIHKYMPQYLSMFHQLDSVDKWYLFGYLIVYLQGGYFCHMDYQLESVPTDSDLILYLSNGKIDHRVFGATPRHPFFKAVLELFQVIKPLTKEESIETNGSGLMNKILTSGVWEYKTIEPTIVPFTQENIVSCLMATRNRETMIYPSVSSFLSQTYDARELIIIDTSAEADNMLFNLDRVRYYHIPEINHLKLGQIRNILVNIAGGDYIAQWDDDDIRPFTSLGYQLEKMLDEETDISFLKRVIMYDRVAKQGWLSIAKLWEATMIVKRDLVSKYPYPAEGKGEDSHVIIEILKQLGLDHIPKYGYYANFLDISPKITYLDEPLLFFYTIHHNNTFDETHFRKFKGIKYEVPLLWKEWMDNNTLICLPVKCSVKGEVHKGRDGLSNVKRLINPIGHREAQVDIYAYMPDKYISQLNSNKTNVIFTTFEYSPIPPTFKEALKKFDICIVPHQAIVDIFKQSGVTTPIKVLHQGFTRYPRYPKQPHKEFVVGTLGVPVHRKNIIQLYHGCKKLQAEGMDIKLLLHNPIKYADFTPPILNDPMVEVTYGSMSVVNTGKWFSKLDCYIFPSSAEGWSYTPRESLYLGIPTIITPVPVHNEILNWCHIIDCPKKILAYDLAINKFEGEWLLVTIDAIADSIRTVYKKYVFYQQLAQEGRIHIENMWFNSSVTEELYLFCNSLFSQTNEKKLISPTDTHLDDISRKTNQVVVV
jgi:glycosyltransferase involved in cell wall biosynthesis